ncbi:hypothetical protein ATO12_11045 [Aquimarina atlantica]|uniref:RNA polymerase sigma-70 region 2 domain-containing protein n=1 Tax=Aquimarina atlantica TaxID=1317122 RepID=A0A023BMS0_9FLAO|nr:sigma-70 family RNA polymerase sigma factor [Aquimarina atlantica]EZH71291.1 hypothetical protein ATO12_11045 [Aquimarina atlantica]
MGNKKNDIILEGIITGDKIILSDFYKQSTRYVRRYIIQNSGCEQDVEDIVQDALILIYQKLTKDTLELNCSIYTYFYGVCKNIWRNRLRRKKKITLGEAFITENNECFDDSIIDDIEKNEQEHLYRKYFLKLNDSNKKLLNHYFEGKSMREIANLMGYSEGYVRKKKFEAKKRLLEIIEQNSSYFELKACE